MHRLVQKPAFEESGGAWARPGPYRLRGLRCRFGYESCPWQWSPLSRTVERKPSKLTGHRGHFSSGVSSGAYGPVILCPPSVTGARGAVPADGRRSQPGLEAHAPRRTGSLAVCCPRGAMSRYQNSADRGSLWQRAHHVVTAQPQSSWPTWALLLALISVLRSLVWKLGCCFTFVRAPGKQSEEVNPRSSSSVEKGVCSPCPHVVLSALRVHPTFRMITEFLLS